MKILFTGASSFTGFWFVKELIAAGHEVVAIFQRNLEEYADLRRQRIEQIIPMCKPVFSCSFGSETFLELLKGSLCWDLFCHHAADVTDYKSPRFDIAKALDNNTKNLQAIAQILKEKNCKRILLTGSVFEQMEGAGSDHLPAFSLYGLSKGFTGTIFEYYAAQHHLALGKFIIPNPFGPFEEVRFTTYLIKQWFEKKCASVNTPVYIRDNIHVSLLAKAYVKFATEFPETPGFYKTGPSGYPESQGTFTARFASEMRKRLQLPCEYKLENQTTFSEPAVRINTDILAYRNLEWVESQAWDELAKYYQKQYG